MANMTPTPPPYQRALPGHTPSGHTGTNFHVRDGLGSYSYGRIHDQVSRSDQVEQGQMAEDLAEVRALKEEVTSLKNKIDIVESKNASSKKSLAKVPPELFVSV